MYNGIRIDVQGGGAGGSLGRRGGVEADLVMGGYGVVRVAG